MRKYLVFLFITLTAFLGAQGVDQSEFDPILTRTINFQNFTGTYQRIDSLSAIRGIGQELARGVIRDRDSRGTYGGRYIMHHILGTDQEPGRPADILELLPQAGVDHIDNVRRIIVAYLEQAYGYSAQDARTLSIFITIYNAVYRGNMDFFKERYKASVMAIIRPDSAGIALSYRDWPGKTQIFIPLNRNIKDGTQTATVAASDLVQDQVIETIRDTTNRGIEERKELADLIDQTIDEQKDDLEAKAQEVAEKTEALRELEAAQAQTTTTNQNNSNSNTNTNTTQTTPTNNQNNTTTETNNNQTTNTTNNQASNTETATSTTTTTTEEQRAAIEEAKQELEEAKTELANLEEEIKASEEAVDELRNSAAEDIKEQENAEARMSAPQLFPFARVESGIVLSTLQRVDPLTGDVLQKVNNLDVVGKAFIPYAGSLLVMKHESGQGKLTIINKETLAITKTGTDSLSIHGDLVAIAEKDIYAVIAKDGQFFIARFNADLTLQATSRIAVDKASAILVIESSLFVQRTDGRMTTLQAQTLDTVR